MKLKILILLAVILWQHADAQVADQITVINDQTTSETPGSFSREVRFKFKWNSSIGLPTGTGSYSSLMAISPWSDDTGGPTHELNFNQQGIYWRQGLRSSGWGSWKNILTDDGNGNVGIGTISPNAKLTVNQINPSGWGGNLNAISVVSPDNLYHLDVNTYVVASGNVGYHFSPNGNTGMVVTTPGNVGIGTTSPDAKLAVKGQVHAQEVKVDLNGAVAPDYVFEKDYQLTSLEEIKNYIDQNKHLPEVPSAAAMEKNGVQLGEMNMLLLKKIEELTLYVIELKKSSDEFKNESELRKNDNADLRRRLEVLENKK